MNIEQLREAQEVNSRIKAYLEKQLEKLRPNWHFFDVDNWYIDSETEDGIFISVDYTFSCMGPGNDSDLIYITHDQLKEI
jgi:hypothetical protein